jgi:hypothetical protein
MTPALIPVNTPRGLAAINSRVPALFLPHAKAAERFWEFFQALLWGSLAIHPLIESKSLARFCCDFLNLQRLAESAFCHFVTAIES